MRFPPIKPVPDDATQADRDRMLNEFKLAVVAMYPNCFLPVGVRKRWWHWFKMQHPLTEI